MEQLSSETGEESVILTASLTDGTLCHLGSSRGKNFLHGREEITKQFLYHCLKGESIHYFTLYLLVSTDYDNFNKQFGPRSGATKCRA